MGGATSMPSARNHAMPAARSAESAGTELGRTTWTERIGRFEVSLMTGMMAAREASGKRLSRLEGAFDLHRFRASC